ncbi:MAG: GH92 family glycosyl hydrolase [Prevotella sp.]|nr:GH92 family glycosyl hydrolase [Prevotella sp.]
MKTSRLFSVMAALAVALSLSAAGKLTQQVNPFIGTGGHGHVFIGANVPFGFVQLGPTQYTQGWDWCSGYHYSDSVLVGFGMMHLSGTGIGDLGDVTLLPTLCPCRKDVRFSHRAERCTPGYYAVTLDGGIHVELTATERCGMHRYTLPADVERGYVRLNLKQGIGWDNMKQCQVRVESPTMLSGYRFSLGWARNQKVFYAIEFSRPVTREEPATDSISVFSFDNNGQPLLVRVGLSPVSVEGAKANLKAEMNTWDFQAILRDADRKWNEQLGKVQLEGGSSDERTTFYTALYHTMTAPSLFCDVDGTYRGADDQIHHGTANATYTTFSLWDTYRAAHPLMTLIHPERQQAMAYTLLNIYKEQGKLPVWHLMGNETDCMVGNPGIPVLADLVLKGFADDAQQCLEAMTTSAMLDERGMDLLKKYGYLPFDLHPDHESVAKTLEYALADWCVARVAAKLKDKQTQKYFDKRAQSYRRLFDPQTGFMRGLDSNGKFREPFNPFHSVHRQNDYTEGNAWQYTWLVPHDVHGLVSLFGSEQKFVEKLDSLFIAEGDLGEDASPDISGLIGQYAHGNEPSHHILYMYNYIGQPWKGARLIRQTMRDMYRNDFDGLSGNEDVGQMSAWYVLSALGLYQVEPAGGKYIIGTPLFDEADINVGNGRTFRIIACDNSPENIYVQSATLNGRPYTRTYLQFNDIVKGGFLELQMGPQPSAWGTKKADRP